MAHRNAGKKKPCWRSASSLGGTEGGALKHIWWQYSHGVNKGTLAKNVAKVEFPLNLLFLITDTHNPNIVADSSSFVG